MKFKNAKIVCKSANPEDYHASKFERGDPKFVVSSSMLRLFAQNPKRWLDGYSSPDSDAKKFGSLLDTRLLVPEQFEKRFSVRPSTYKNEKDEEKPFNLNSNVCKEWVKEQGEKEIITQNDLAEVNQAVSKLMADETIKEWIECCDNQVWITADYEDEATKLTIPIQVLIDFLPRNGTQFMKALGDLKAVRSAAQGPFAKQVFQLGWHFQAAFYLDALISACNEDRSDFIFICQENYPPYAVGRRLLSLDFVEIGRATYKDALKRYAKCLKTGVWEGYDAPEEFSLVQPTPWMEFEAISSQMEASQLESMADNYEITP